MALQQYLGRPEVLMPLARYSSSQVKLPAGSYFKLGSSWFNLTSDIYYTTSSPAANTLYAVYAYNNSGTIALTASTTMPSAIGSAYKLVGAYFVQSDLTISEAFNPFVKTETYLGFITTTGSWATNTTYIGEYWRSGKFLKGWVRVNTSNPPNVTGMQINIPMGLGMDQVLMNTTNAYIPLGKGMIRDSGVFFGLTSLYYSSTTQLQVFYYDDGTGIVLSTACDASSPMAFTSGDSINVDYEVPITSWSNLSVSEL